MQDLRYAVRVLRNSPGFAAVAILTLAVGIGANTALFSVVNALLLRPLPYKDPARMVLVCQTWPQKGFPRLPAFNALYGELRRSSRALQEIAGFENVRYNLTGVGEPERLEGCRVSSSFFRLLGVAPFAGRTFSDAEDSPGANRVAVLSQGLWKRRFGANRETIGRTVNLNGAPHTVIGIMPPEFRFSASLARTDTEFSDADFWVPLALTPQELDAIDSADLMVAARLRPGATLAQAREDASRAQRAVVERTKADLGMGVRVAALQQDVVGDAGPPLLILLGAVGCVLLIACSNLAGLLVARGTARQKEIAIRLAIGAQRQHIVREMLAESMLLAAAGGTLGLLISTWATRVLVKLSPADLRRAAEIGIDGNVLAFTMLASLLTSLLFGLVPALKLSNPDVSGQLKEIGRGLSAGRRQQRMHSILVTVQIGIALMLMIGAALMIESFVRLRSVNPGFERRGILTADVQLPRSKYGDRFRRRAFFGEVLQRVQALPGVRAAGIASRMPLGDISEGLFTVKGRPRPKLAETPITAFRWVSPDYFRAMGIALLRGRGFTSADAEGAPHVVIVDALAARRYWPNEDPIGRQIKFGEFGSDAPWFTVIGVAGSIRQYGLDLDARPGTYIPYLQGDWEGMSVVVRTGADPKMFIKSLREAVQSVDRDQPLANVRTMEEAAAKSISQRSFNTGMLGAFAVSALVLAILGIYGVMAFSVSQRTREIGVRMAVGATGRDVLALVVRQGMALAAVGIALGIGGAFALTRVLGALLYNVSPTDPATFVAVSALLASVAFLACFIPARRAACAAPAEALRCQ